MLSKRHEKSNKAYRALKFSTQATINEIRRQRRQDVNDLKREMKVMKDEFTAMIDTMKYHPTDDPLTDVLQASSSNRQLNNQSQPALSSDVATLTEELTEAGELQQKDQDYEYIYSPIQGSSSSNQPSASAQYRLSPSDTVANLNMERAE